MGKPLTIASLQARGVSQLVVYCRGKRTGDWPCHREGTLPIDRFQADEILGDNEQRCRCTACGWRRADLRPDYSKQEAPRQSVGWINAAKGLNRSAPQHCKNVIQLKNGYGVGSGPLSVPAESTAPTFSPSPSPP